MSPFLRGLLSKDNSFATGLLLGLLVWTFTRIADGITGSGTIEYDVTYAATTLKDGRAGALVSVVLTNLSHDTAVQNLEVTISDPLATTEFIPGEEHCAYPPPTWAQDAKCEAFPTGLNFYAPWLVPGNQVSLAIKYVGSLEPGKRPIVRIRPSDTDTKLRVIEPGFETWVARHEMGVLFAILIVASLLLMASVAAGITRDPPLPP